MATNLFDPKNLQAVARRSLQRFSPEEEEDDQSKPQRRGGGSRSRGGMLKQAKSKRTARREAKKAAREEKRLAGEGTAVKRKPPKGEKANPLNVRQRQSGKGTVTPRAGKKAKQTAVQRTGRPGKMEKLLEDRSGSPSKMQPTTVRRP